MLILKMLEGLCGAAIVWVVLFDVFQSVVVPRRAAGRLRLSALLVPRFWSLWRRIGLGMPSAGRRESYLASFAALAVIVLLLMWVFILVCGFGLMLHAMHSQIRPESDSFGTALYLAGTALLTLGFGDFVATEAPARITTLVAAASGFGLFALVITLLFTLYGSFQRREAAVVVLQAAAGAPPSGVTLLETYATNGILADLPRLFSEWQLWSAEVLDSHLAYPLLVYFRASHDNDSWVSSLGAVMDSATLVLTTLENAPTGWAKLSLSVGTHCLEDLVEAFNLPSIATVGLERAEFDEARERLSRAGFALRDADRSWHAFAALRATYAGDVNALAGYLATPPAQWIGDRSLLPHHITR